MAKRVGRWVIEGENVNANANAMGGLLPGMVKPQQDKWSILWKHKHLQQRMGSNENLHPILS